MQVSLSLSLSVSLPPPTLWTKAINGVYSNSFALLLFCAAAPSHASTKKTHLNKNKTIRPRSPIPQVKPSIHAQAPPTWTPYVTPFLAKPVFRPSGTVLGSGILTLHTLWHHFFGFLTWTGGPPDGIDRTVARCVLWCLGMTDAGMAGPLAESVRERLGALGRKVSGSTAAADITVYTSWMMSL